MLDSIAMARFARGMPITRALLESWASPSRKARPLTLTLTLTLAMTLTLALAQTQTLTLTLTLTPNPTPAQVLPA